MNIDFDEIELLILEAVDVYIWPRYKALEDCDIHTKSGPMDLVTCADIEAERFLTAELKRLYPDAIIIGEEAVSSGDVTLDALQKDEGMVFVIDPVDGTRNFVLGNDCFGIMVACVINGVTQRSWIFDIPGRLMYTAEKGQGAYCDGHKLKVVSKPVNKMRAHINYRFFPSSVQEKIKKSAERLGNMEPLGCAAHEYTRIVTGHSQASLYCRLKPWDHLAGALMVQEAGGYVAKWDRGPFTPKDDFAGLIVTTSKESWDQLYDVFFKELDLALV